MATEHMNFVMEHALIQRLGVAFATSYEGEYLAFLTANGKDPETDKGALLWEFLAEKTRGYWKEVLVGYESQAAGEQAAQTAEATARAVDIPVPDTSTHT